MKSRILRVCFSLMVMSILASCAAWPGKTESDIPKQMLARQLLVTVPDKLKPQWPAIRKELAQTQKLIETGEFPLDSIGVNCFVYQVPSWQSLAKVKQVLEADKRVGLVQENQVFEGIQGGESDDFAGLSYAPHLLKADAAHQITTGKGVKVAIVDTGAEKEHPDLKGRINASANFVEGGDLNFSRDTHGTAVAGALGARADDGIGIYGIAPKADINLYKACWYPDGVSAKAQCSSWSLAKALNAAITANVQVINLSLAGPYDELLDTLLETAHKRGIHITAAALEKQNTPGFPATLPFVIPVISADINGTINSPPWLTVKAGTVAAPGLEILTTVPNGGYDFISGSSLATAHVSGVIALLLAVQPTLNPDQLKSLLLGDHVDSKPVLIDTCALLVKLGHGGGCQ